MIQRAAYPAPTLVEHMCIDHCRAHILVPQQLLDGADVTAIFEQVRGEAVTQGVAADRLAEMAARRRMVNVALQVFLIQVMAPQHGIAARGGKVAGSEDIM